eukprot:CAMPEP_0172491650 /NCGR_PEP_ID=MMETSP1066-20121228/22527_1 /TAXON_ID=671091 /ORGANISM="Coscinodiscus wailesii, Strain CCMP2513" /LENGTH=613 /DNA_ID=CAMNT_0013260811 /DNA_START=293 /DNA_END=2134 /DNA_ORIENTATION=-
MTGIGAYSMSNGDYRRVIYPMDYSGNICGTNLGNGTADMTEYPYLYYVNGMLDGVCVKECPTFSNGLADEYALVTFGGLWKVEGTKTYPADNIEIANYNDSSFVKYCDEETCYPDDNTVASFKSTGVNKGYGFAFYLMDTRSRMNRCIPSTKSFNYLVNVTKADKDSNVLSDINSTAGWLADLTGDLYKARAIILGWGFGAALFLSAFYSFMLRFPGIIEIMVWGSILTTIGLVFGAGAYGIVLSYQWVSDSPRVHTDKEVTNARIVSSFIIIFGTILTCITCFLRKQIVLAMGCTEETSRAIKRMPLVILLPVLGGIATIIFVALFITYGIFLMSVGETYIQTRTNNGVQSTYRSFEYNQFQMGGGIFLIFAFFVTIQFISAIVSLTISTSVATWYFTRDKSEISSGTVFQSLHTVFCKHQGTAAFGSFIIGFVQLIRAFLSWLFKVASGADNKFAEGVLCCCKCCFACVEKFLKFINKNAYIQTAIFGFGFCKASEQAFYLIMRNAARIGSIEWVSQTLTIIGRLLIVAAVTSTSYFIIGASIGSELTSLYGPLFFIAAIAYFVADMFMDIYDMGVLTILQCFIADEEMFDGDECYAEHELKTWIDKWEEN